MISELGQNLLTLLSSRVFLFQNLIHSTTNFDVKVAKKLKGAVQRDGSGKN